MDQALIVFITTANERNFSRAAEKLHMTQPAVSQYIKALEERYDTILLERSNKSVSLTKAGEVVYHYAEEILSLYDQMAHVIQDLVTLPSGPLNIGASYTFGEYKLPHILAKIHNTFPNISPSITIDNTTRIVELVENKTIDIGIIEGNVHHPSRQLSIDPFMIDEMGVVASTQHPLANQEQINPLVLSKDTWILREEGSGTREMADRFLKDASLTPEAILHFGSTQVIKESVEAGLGISFLSRNVIQKEIELGTLCLLDVKGLPTQRSFSTVTRHSPFMTKATKVFIEYLHELKPR